MTKEYKIYATIIIAIEVVILICNILLAVMLYTSTNTTPQRVTMNVDTTGQYEQITQRLDNIEQILANMYTEDKTGEIATYNLKD